MITQRFCKKRFYWKFRKCDHSLARFTEWNTKSKGFFYRKLFIQSVRKCV